MSTVIHCSNASTSTTFTSWFQQSHIFSSASWFANEKLKPILLENSWILLAWWRGSRIAINEILYIFTSLPTLLLDLMLPMPLIFHKRLLIMANKTMEEVWKERANALVRSYSSSILVLWQMYLAAPCRIHILFLGTVSVLEYRSCR